jgi:quercetin dioxygenase-like cupin family protein
MPTIYDASNLETNRRGGVARTALANLALLGSDALVVERLTCEPGAQTPAASAPGQEKFIYVIRGAGVARVGSESFSLETESMLWLDLGDIYTLEAGADGLEILVCRAPGSLPAGSTG